jgi:eukaryotic translation initiation factor 2C
MLLSSFSFLSCKDVSTTMILTPGPVIDFLIVNQNVREPRYVDWVKVRNC